MPAKKYRVELTPEERGELNEWLRKGDSVCSGLITSHQMKGVTSCSIKRKRDPNNGKATLSC